MCYCDSPKFFRQKAVRARKQHACCECGVEIQPGDTYHVSTGMWDKDFNTYRQCVDCYWIAGYILSVADCPCDVCFGFLCDWVHELRGDDLDSDTREAFRRFEDRRGRVANNTAAIE